ncbi:MAG: O-methyltransferase [Anaerolineae bacterium]|nr:O-methyltransferase [Anaerolineae bacterium]
MFHNIPEAVRARMAYLESLDAQDRTDGTPKSQRLRQIPPETGKFIALLAASAPAAGAVIEIGSSAGYSTLWLALACRASGRRMTTFEYSPEKAHLAQETFQMCGVEEVVELVVADARRELQRYEQIAFCFLDAEKEIYLECYELIVPRLALGGLLVADNALSHQADLQPLLNRAGSDERVDALVVPIGKGELVCRKADF